MNELINLAHTFKKSYRPDVNWLGRMTTSFMREYHASICLAGVRTCKHMYIEWQILNQDVMLLNVSKWPGLLLGGWCSVRGAESPPHSLAFLRVLYFRCIVGGIVT